MMNSNETNFHKKYSLNELDQALIFFVKQGYLCIEGVHSIAVIDKIFKYISIRFERLIEASKHGEIKYDVNGWAVGIIKKFEQTELYEEFIQQKNMFNILQRLLGPDVCIFGQEALWINHPLDTDPVLNKGVHSDAWTGTSVNTLFSKCFFTDVDEYNSMTVVPGSHLYGFVPSRNRSVDPYAYIDDCLGEVNLSSIKAGDVLIWHALTLHATAGHSNINTRFSITSRYTSTETAFSSQERSLGYRPLTVGPMNQILRIIGNDLLSPFRTLGGFVGVDRRLQHLYGLTDYKSETDFAGYL